MITKIKIKQKIKYWVKLYMKQNKHKIKIKQAYKQRK